MIQLSHQRAQLVQGLRALAQVRAATAQVQRRKWLLVRSRFVADYSDNNTPI
jgi:hypothetical protein